MERFPNELIDGLRADHDIVTVAEALGSKCARCGNALTLKKKLRAFRCRKCGTGGDVFRLLMEHHGQTFYQVATRLLSISMLRMVGVVKPYGL